MIIHRVIVFFIVFALIGCVSVDKDSAKFIGANPTSYVFEKNIVDLNKSIIELFNNAVYKMENPISLRKFGEIFLYHVSDPENHNLYRNLTINEYDIFIKIETWVSDIYKFNGKGLPMNGVFHLKLRKLEDNKTKITVDPILLTTLFSSGINAGHGTIPIKKKVKPTSIEEYAILSYIGKYLKINMPSIKRPNF